MFHDTWTEVDSENFFELGAQRFLDTRGYNTSTKIQSLEIPDYAMFEEKEIKEDCIEVLDKIVDLCRKNDIQVIFYTCPYADEYNYSDAMKEYVKNKECVYFNLYEYIDEMKLDGNTDLQDVGHLN